MKLKQYEAFLADNKTHVVAASFTLQADGYMSALSSAHKICKDNHEGFYVAQVQETK